jgi:hypothetical protein
VKMLGSACMKTFISPHQLISQYGSRDNPCVISSFRVSTSHGAGFFPDYEFGRNGYAHQIMSKNALRCVNRSYRPTHHRESLSSSVILGRFELTALSIQSSLSEMENGCICVSVIFSEVHGRLTMYSTQ